VTAKTSKRRLLVAQVIPPLLLFVALIALWELAVSDEWISSLILPHPWEVVEGFSELVSGEVLWPNLRATAWEIIAGFLLGSGAGIALAVACALSVVARRTIYPYVVALQVTPRIALAPMLVAWLGFGDSPKIVLAATICFFPVFLNALTGMAAAEREAQEMFRSLGASRTRTFLHLRLPAALPVTFAGLKTALTLAMIGAVVGEFITGDKGLGLLLQRYSYQGEMGLAFAVLLILTLIGFVLYGFMEYLDRILIFWSHESRMSARTRRRQKRDQKSATKGQELSLGVRKAVGGRGEKQSKEETIR
jgi:NitT/TauT family transport system permease protein